MREESTGVAAVTAANREKEKIERLYKVTGPTREKTAAALLFNAGKIAYFDEYYFDIKLENQEIGKIGQFDDPRVTENFKKGYKRGQEIVSSVEKTGLTGALPEKYQEIASQNNKARR